MYDFICRLLRRDLFDVIDYRGAQTQIERAAQRQGERSRAGQRFELGARQLILHQLQRLPHRPKSCLARMVGWIRARNAPAFFKIVVA